jgi:hypothetical protein
MKTIFLLSLLTACGTSESGSLLTTGISAEMGAVTTGNGSTRVTAELFEGNPDQLIFVDLQAGDSLVADINGQSMTLAKAQLLTIIDYEAVFPTGNARSTAAHRPRLRRCPRRSRSTRSRRRMRARRRSR